MNDDLKTAQDALDQEEVVETPVEEAPTAVEEPVAEVVQEEENLEQNTQQEDLVEAPAEDVETPSTTVDADTEASPVSDEEAQQTPAEEVLPEDTSGARWYVVHTYSGHENRVATALRQRIEAEHLENKIYEVLVPTQDKIEIRGGKKVTDKEKIFPGYMLVKMILDDDTWLAVRTTQGVTSFIGMGNKPTPISSAEVASIVKFAAQGGQPTYKQAFNEGDTVKIVDGPFTEFIGKVDNVDKDRGKVRVLVSIFGRETPVELDFLQVQKL